MTVKITTSIGGTVPTQDYGNIQPRYTIERELPDGMSDKDLQETMTTDRDIVEDLYKDRDGQFRKLIEGKH